MTTEEKIITLAEAIKTIAQNTMDSVYGPSTLSQNITEQMNNIINDKKEQE